MKLEIVSPDGILFEGETESVSFPGVAGSFDILPHHAPLIAALKAGTIRFEANGKRQEQTIQSGFVEVKDDDMKMLADSFSMEPELRGALSNPIVSVPEKVKLLTAAGGIEVCELYTRFINLVLAHKRETLLPSSHTFISICTGKRRRLPGYDSTQP